MKKILLFGAIIILGSTKNSVAQEFSYGIKGSIGIAGLISGNDTNDESARFSYTFGGFTEYRFRNEWFATQVEVFYAEQGTAKTDNDLYDMPIDDLDISLNYLNVPLLAKFYFTEGLNAYAGPQVGFLLTSKIDKEDATESFESIDFGIVAGIQYVFNNKIFVGGRFNLGLTGVSAEPTIENYKNFLFQVGTGYKF